jgi:hypothetical protein
MTFDKKNGNLFESLVILADSLRKKGFKEEAKRLDERICNYKTAEIHLYNTFEETGDDLLGSAHPDGDLALCPAKDHLGDIETEPSKHKKIVDVVNKVPTGKFASAKVEEIVKQTAMVLGLEKMAEKKRPIDIINNLVKFTPYLTPAVVPQLAGDFIKWVGPDAWERLTGETLSDSLGVTVQKLKPYWVQMAKQYSEETFKSLDKAKKNMEEEKAQQAAALLDTETGSPNKIDKDILISKLINPT